MRLIKNRIERDGTGFVTLLPEEPEDMWHAYNLIRPGDLLNASAIRRVKSTSAVGTTDSQRVHLNLQIRVKSLDFDPQASQLHVSGLIVKETQYTKLGQHHTLDLELQRNFTLEKGGEDGEGGGWDSIAVDMLKDAVDLEGKRAEAVAVVMQEGLANICFVGEWRTVVKQRIDYSVPKKRQGGASDYDKGLGKFFQLTLETLLRYVDFNDPKPKPILLASPGFTATSFLKYINDFASRTTNKPLLAYKPNFMVIHTSSGHVHSLNEVLKSPEVLATLKDTKYARETQLMDEFLTRLRREDDRATYGMREVENAVEKGAVGRGGGVLLISDKLFRAQDIGERRRWVRLVDQVRDTEGGDVRVLSSEHESGKRLEGLGGVAALLTFPIDDEELGEDDD